MVRKRIVWTQRALSDVKMISDFTMKLWGNSIRHRFVVDVNRGIKRIQQFSTIYPVFEDSQLIRRGLASRHVALYYQVVDEGIVLLRIYPTRMKPLEFDESG